MPALYGSSLNVLFPNGLKLGSWVLIKHSVEYGNFILLIVKRCAIVGISARRADQLAEVSARKMLVLPADITDLPSLELAAEENRNQLCPIDIAVSSAGYWRHMTESEWQSKTFNEHVRVNLIEALRISLASSKCGCDNYLSGVRPH